MTRRVIIGHSHCTAIAQALRDWDVPGHQISVHQLNARDGVDIAISGSDAVQLVAVLPPDARIFLVVLGGYHNLLGLLRSGEPFDVLVDASDAVDPLATTLIPHRALTGAFDDQFEGIEKIDALIDAAPCPVILLSSPPPKRDNEFVLERFMAQKSREYRGRSVEDYGVERPEARLKLWRLEAGIMAKWAESRGVQFLAAPEAASDSEGYLRKDCYAEDVTHANATYGRLVLEQVSSHP